MEAWLQRREGKLEQMRKERDIEIRSRSRSLSTEKGIAGEETVTRACSRLYALHRVQQEKIEQIRERRQGGIDDSSSFLSHIAYDASSDDTTNSKLNLRSQSRSRATSRRLVDRNALIGLRRALQSQGYGKTVGLTGNRGPSPMHNRYSQSGPRSRSQSSSRSRSISCSRSLSVDHCDVNTPQGSSILESMIASLL